MVANPVRGQKEVRRSTGGRDGEEQQPVNRYSKRGSMYGQHFKQSMDQPGMVADPARGQLNREK